MSSYKQTLYRLVDAVADEVVVEEDAAVQWGTLANRPGKSYLCDQIIDIMREFKEGATKEEIQGALYDRRIISITGEVLN